MKKTEINRLEFDPTREVLLLGTNFKDETISEYLINTKEYFTIGITDDEITTDINDIQVQTDGHVTLIYKDNMTDMLKNYIKEQVEDDDYGINQVMTLTNCSFIEVFVKDDFTSNLLKADIDDDYEGYILYALDHLSLEDDNYDIYESFFKTDADIEDHGDNDINFWI